MCIRDSIQDDPSSGFEDGVALPRFSSGYFWLRNRLGMLVETHSWKEYPVRVRITRNTVVSVLEQLAAHGSDWLRMAQQADANAVSYTHLDVYKRQATGTARRC